MGRDFRIGAGLRLALALACSIGQACGDASATTRTPLLLVSQAGSTTLAVVDPELNRVVKRIQVGQLPHRMVATRDGHTVYVVLVGSQAIAEVDARALELRRTWLTAPVPLQRDDGRPIDAHTAERAAEHSSCFDCHHGGGASPAIVGERPVGIALSADETQLYISHIKHTRLSLLDTGSGELVRSELLPSRGSAIEAADLVRLDGTLVVSLRPTQPSTDSAFVRFLDEDTWLTRAEFETGSDPAALLALEARDSVLSAQFESDRMQEFSEARPARSFTVTPGPLGSQLLPDAKHVLSLNYYSNAASLLDLDSGEVAALSLEHAGQTYVNPTHAAIDPAGETAYIVSSGTDGHLLVFDLVRRQVRAAIPIDGLSFDVVAIPRDDAD